MSVSSGGLRAVSESCGVFSQSACSHACDYCCPAPSATTRDWLVLPSWQTPYRIHLVFRVSIRTGQEGLVVSIVEPCSITRLGFGSKSFVVCQDSDIPITECVAFDGDAFDVPLYLTRIPETIPDECHTRIRR